MKKQRVVCLGAGGFIGSNLVAFLKKRGHWVRAVDIQFPGFRKELWSQADEVVTVDLRYYGLIFAALSPSYKSSGGEKPIPFDWVFHLAADMGGVGYFHSDKDQKAARNNMLIDLNVLNALGPEQRLFFSSSACAYDTRLQGEAGKPVSLNEEKHIEGPADALYGEEKKFMLKLCGKQPNARVGILHTVYGEFQEYEGERMKFPTAITKKVIEAKDMPHASNRYPIEIWGDGTQIRTFLYIQDALEKIYRVMEAEEYHGPVNIGSDEEITVQEAADALCDYAGIAPHYVYQKDKPTGVRSRSSDNTKFDKHYGRVPQTPAKDGFARLYDWMNQLDKEDK